MALDITTARTDIAKIYIAAFDRAPDSAGLNFWVNTYMAGTDTLTTIAQKFTNSTEYATTYPSYLTDGEFVEKIYTNVFDRASDTDGKAFWVGHLAAGTLTRGTLMKAMVDAAMANASTDGTRLTAEAEAGVQSVISGTTTGSTFTLTTGADAVTGTANNDTFVATEASLSSADVLNGAGGTDTLRYASSGAVAITESGFEATGIETVQVTSDATGGTAFDVTGVTDLETLKNYNSSEDLTFTGADAIATIVLDNLGAADRATEIVDTTVVYNAAVVTGITDPQSVTLNGNMNVDGSSVGALTVNGIETFAVTTTGAASIIDSVVSNTLKAVTIAGDQALTLGSTVNGTGLTLTDTTAANTVDASAMTAALNLNLLNDNAVDVEVSTGSANDTVTFVSFDTDDTFNGGAGTDTISLTNAVATARTITNGGTLTDVEQLNVNTAGTGTIDMDAFSGVTKVIFDADITALATSTVDDAVTGITVEVDTSATTGTLVVDLKTDGTADEITIQLDDIAAGEAITSIDAADAETLNISADDDTVNGVGTMTITSLTATDATTLNLSGDADLTIVNAVDPVTPVLATINASTMTGDLTISGMNTKATGATITLGSGDDTFNVATSNGADTITLGAGEDTIVYTAVAQSDDQMDTITDFVQGTDTLNLDALLMAAAPNSTAFVGNRATFALAQGALPGTGVAATGQMAVFQQDANTLWIDSDANGTLDSNDFRIKLDGITTLTAADLGFGTGNTVTLTAAAAVVNTTTNTNADEMTTNEDDTINSTIAYLAGSTVTAALGADVLNITDDMAGANISAYAITGVETINIVGASVASTMLNGAGLIVNATGATTLTLGTGGQTYNGSASNDAITNGGGNDTVILGNGTNSYTAVGATTDDITGGTGVDTFNMINRLTVLDTIDGGAGADILNVTDDTTTTDLNGVTNVETINITNTNSTEYDTIDSLVAAGATLTVNGLAAQVVDFDGSLETDGSFIFAVNTAANHILLGGALADTFSTTGVGVMTLTGNGGNDTFTMGANLTSADTINGGTGSDTVNVTDDTATTDLDGITNVEIINIVNTNATAYTPANTVVAAGETLTINAAGAGGVTLDFSAETDGHLVITTTGEALTSVTGGALSDTITGGAGADKYVVTAGVTVANFDTLVNWNFDADSIDTAGAAAQVESATVATADATTLIANMQTAINTAIAGGAVWGTAANDVMVVTVSAGASAGTYLVIADGANTAITAADFIVEITGYSGTIDAGDFA